jgi:hypothetical protein
LLGGRVVYEVKLGDEYLMSSLFTEAERQLAILGLRGLEGDLDVVIGGLGLGYTAEGLTSIANQLKTRGVFALWSNVPVDDEFTAHLESVFGKASGHIIEFPNPYTNETSMNSVYVARKAG